MNQINSKKKVIIIVLIVQVIYQTKKNNTILLLFSHFFKLFKEGEKICPQFIRIYRFTYSMCNGWSSFHLFFLKKKKIRKRFLSRDVIILSIVSVFYTTLNFKITFEHCKHANSFCLSQIFVDRKLLNCSFNHSSLVCLIDWQLRCGLSS